MGFPDPDSACRRHPNQRNQPGVCSLCLRDRLSKISSGNWSYRTARSAFSDVSSASSSPPEKRRPSHRRNGSDVAVPLGFVFHQGGCNGRRDVNDGSLLKKSRSVACAPRIYRPGGGAAAGEADNSKEAKSAKINGRSGFWKKLIHSTSRKTKGALTQSMTAEERSHHDRDSSSPKF